MEIANAKQDYAPFSATDHSVEGRHDISEQAKDESDLTRVLATNRTLSRALGLTSGSRGLGVTLPIVDRRMGP